MFTCVAKIGFVRVITVLVAIVYALVLVIFVTPAFVLVTEHLMLISCIRILLLPILIRASFPCFDLPS